MADNVDFQLMFEMIKSTREDVRGLKEWRQDIKEELTGIRLHQHAAQGEINNTYSRLGSVENRLDRIERRLEIISEPAE